jgi:FKBP-type peptidyl-prolyl cis-trans isomerase FkpA
MVKKWVVSLLISVVAISCLKSPEYNCPYTASDITAPTSEQAIVKAYLDTNHIAAVKHPSGFYYTIQNPGTGADSVELCHQIFLNYKGKLANGSVFDEGKEAFFVLGALIEGWRKGIPLVRRGGKITLYIPPSLGYGSQPVENGGQVIIPANSMLIFDVELLDYKAQN